MRCSWKIISPRFKPTHHISFVGVMECRERFCLNCSRLRRKLFFTRRGVAACLLGFSPYQKVLAAMRVIVYNILADYTGASSHWRRYDSQPLCGCLPRFWSGILVSSTSELPMKRTQIGWRTQWSKRTTGYAWERRLHALAVEEMPCCLARAVHWLSSRSNYFSWTGCLSGLVDLALFLWVSQVCQWHKNLLRSPIFASLASGDALTRNYTFNCHGYTIGYYLAEGINPS
jgi:hypothetical protein